MPYDGMTDGRAKAICNALSYLITELVPVPKTTDGKQKRKELLMYLSQAAKPTKRDDAELPAAGIAPTPGQPGVRAPDAATNAPEVLRMEMLLPEGALREVRPDTVFGVPKTGTDGWEIADDDAAP